MYVCMYVYRFQWQKELEPITPPPNPDGSYPPAVMQYALPITDEIAPDLYIPSMSLITYVILCALLYGTSGEFTPEVLPDVTTKCILTQIFEVLLMRFGIYSMHMPKTSMLPTTLDLFAYTGYKYLGLCMNMLVGLLGFGRTGYYVGFVWTATSMFYFMLKVMSSGIPRQEQYPSVGGGPKREIIILGFAAFQFFSMWFMSQTKYLE